MSNKIFFIHIPKTAGVTIKEILYDYKYNYSEIEMKKNRDEITDTELFLKPKYLTHFHIPFSFYKKDLQIKLKKEYVLFAIVRNPYERVVSSFKFWTENLSVSKNKRHENIFKTHFKNCSFFDEINKKNLNLFIQFILNSNFKLTDCDGHFIPMHYYTHSKKNKIKSKKKNNFFNKKDYIQNCNYILKFENLNNDFNFFIKELNLNIPLNLIETKHKNVTSKNIISVKDLDDKSIYLIKKHFYIDFTLFNYSFDII